MTDPSPRAVQARLLTLGRLSREQRARVRPVDMSPGAVSRRLRRVSQLRALCAYLMRMR